MRPGKSILDLEAGYVKKKWKTKGFAANINREVIANGALKLEMPLDEVINQTIAGMKTVAVEIGLAGTLVR